MSALEERFLKIVTEMDAELVESKKTIAILESRLRTANYPVEHATTCGKCGNYKHCPWKDDDWAYVCATCLVEIKDEEIAALKATQPTQQTED